VDADLVLVGGGLANSLIAYRLAQTRPDIALLLLERENRLGGEHTWSFNTADLTSDQYDWIRPFVQYQWPGYEVRFPAHTRWIASGYQSITSSRLHDVMVEALGEAVQLNSVVDSIAPTQVTLTDGRTIRAGAVVDGRGPVASAHLVIRYQKFVGQVVRLNRSHELRGPILMDATVEQLDGYRFVYVLPFEADLALIEDTRYSDSPTLDRDDYTTAIERYVDAQGWGMRGVDYEEQGVLPVALSGDIESFWDEATPGVARSGLRAALFHPTTGYSLPNAVRLADRLCEILPLTGSALNNVVRRESVRHWGATGFFRILNRMLFLAGEPPQRFRVFQRFYRLPQSLIDRFYAGQLTAIDRARLLVGRPPVPIGSAAAAVLSSGRVSDEPDVVGSHEEN
jgi:lycopene beta-cyclase